MDQSVCKYCYSPILNKKSILCSGCGMVIEVELSNSEWSKKYGEILIPWELTIFTILSFGLTIYGFIRRSESWGMFIVFALLLLASISIQLYIRMKFVDRLSEQEKYYIQNSQKVQLRKFSGFPLSLIRGAIHSILGIGIIFISLFFIASTLPSHERIFNHAVMLHSPYPVEFIEKDYKGDGMFSFVKTVTVNVNGEKITYIGWLNSIGTEEKNN